MTSDLCLKLPLSANQLPWFRWKWTCPFPLWPAETQQNSRGTDVKHHMDIYVTKRTAWAIFRILNYNFASETIELFLSSNVFKCSKRDRLCFFLFFRQVWTKCESWLMRSTPMWTLPFLLSPWQWWRSLTKMVPGFGTHISVTWRQIFLILSFFFLFIFYKCQTFLLNALNNVGGGITKQTTVSPSHVCVCQESRSLLLEALRLSQNEGFCLGVKLVRGAYMDKERRLAEEEGRLDPIHKSWEDTNDRWIGGSRH